ncbi:hypothetical protein BH10BAC5_BH10BAC5_04510 [soil metagenome]
MKFILLFSILFSLNLSQDLYAFSFFQIKDSLKATGDTLKNSKYLDSLKKSTGNDRDAENKQIQQKNINNGQPEILILELNEIRFEFKNTKTFEEDDLKNLLITGTQTEFSKVEFVNDTKKLEKFYFDNGFFDVKVDTLIHIDNHTSVTATMVISENYRYRTDSINYLGLEEISTAAERQISSNRLVREYDYYNKFNLQLEVTRVISILQNNGYAIASSQPPEIIKTITPDTSLSRRILVNLVFLPGSIFTFGSTDITLTDNSYGIPTDDIKRQLEYNEGDIYSKENLVTSENRISKLSIFENGRIQVKEIDSTNKIIYLMINARVTNKYEIKPEVLGYNISNKFYAGLGLSFTDKYFKGGGRVLTASIRALFNSLEDYRFEGYSELTQPHLFNNDKITGKLKPGVSIYTVSDYKIIQIKNITSISYELPKYTYINNMIAEWNLGNERLNYYVDLKESDTSNVVLLPGPFNLNIFTSSISFTIAHYGTNSTVYPTTGNSAAYTIEESGLLGTIAKSLFNTSADRYLKATTINKFYFHVGQPDALSVIATKLLLGNILEYGENNFTVGDVVLNSLSVPRESKFICGGSSSIRGWRSKGLGNVRDKDFGGNFIIESSVEYRIKPFNYLNSLIKDLGFVAFMDVGNIWEGIKDFKVNQLAAAIGGGIRYYTIVGAIRFDLGWRLYDPDRTDNKWLFEAPLSELFQPARLQFQIGIGNTF